MIRIPFNPTAWWHQLGRLADAAQEAALLPRQREISTQRFNGRLKILPCTDYTQSRLEFSNDGGLVTTGLTFWHERLLPNRPNQEAQWLAGQFDIDRLVLPRRVFNFWNRTYEHSGRDAYFDFTLDNGREGLIFHGYLSAWDGVATVDDGRKDLCIVERPRLHVVNFYANTLEGIESFFQDAIGQGD